MAGRPSLFGLKQGGLWISGGLSEEGSQLFEHKRQELEALLRRHKSEARVSKADVVEYLLRGKQATIAAIKG